MKTFRINARFIVELIIYFFMGRVSFLSISPVPLSVFSIALAEKRKKNPDILCIFAGMFTKCLLWTGFCIKEKYFLGAWE